MSSRGFNITASLFADLSNWDKNLKKAAHQTESFGDRAKTVSRLIKGAFVGIGIDMFRMFFFFFS